MKNAKMALIYDFDKTLSPKDMQEFHLIQRLGYEDPAEFWKTCNDYSQKYNIDGILSYMMVLARLDPEMTQEMLKGEGKYIKLYPGVKEWFLRMNAYGKEHGIDVEHYIISSGIKDIIEGTPIASEFRKIYACSYYYDEQGHAKWPARVVNYTTKTQYLFRINKGVLDERNDMDLNRSTPEEDKYIPYDRMIYFGDGLTDVPSMKVVRQFGGQTIAVFADIDTDPARELQHRATANFVAKADFRSGSRIDHIVKTMIDAVAVEKRLDDYK
ncbi:MAG: haloacid dehalogenase-like hydrolase [Erysipelotrichaceae bacterium]|nr:haloacid dehalogenase-like hydrolase [Erysipelotrichaceae bacterium]